VDGRQDQGGSILPIAGDRLVIGRDTVTRSSLDRPAPAAERWQGLIGEYGWDHNTLFILEKEGQLHALIEWFFLYPLEEVSRDVFNFPNWGLYHGERRAGERPRWRLRAWLSSGAPSVPGKGGRTRFARCAGWKSFARRLWRRRRRTKMGSFVSRT
jgi:hypothetical protein